MYEDMDTMLLVYLNQTLMFGTEMNISTSLLGELLNGFVGRLIVLLYMLRITQLAYCHRY